MATGGSEGGLLGTWVLAKCEEEVSCGASTAATRLRLIDTVSLLRTLLFAPAREYVLRIGLRELARPSEGGVMSSTRGYLLDKRMLFVAVSFEDVPSADASTAEAG